MTRRHVENEDRGRKERKTEERDLQVSIESWMLGYVHLQPTREHIFVRGFVATLTCELFVTLRFVCMRSQINVNNLKASFPVCDSSKME